MARAMQIAEEACSTSHGDSYVGCDLPAVKSIEPTIQAGNGATPNDPTNLGVKTFTVSATAASTNTTFTIEKNPNGTVDRSCDAPNMGSCRKVGTNTTTGTW